MLVNMCFRRFIWHKRVLLSTFVTCNRFSNNYYHTAVAISSHGNSCYRFDPVRTQVPVRGLKFNSIEFPKSFFSRSQCERVEEEEEEVCKRIEGDIVNLSELLFTKDRDYLLKYNDSQLVTVEQLAGKMVVIFFMPLSRCQSFLNEDRHLTPEYIFPLIDTYNGLKSKNCFEVVIIGVDDTTNFGPELGDLCTDASIQRKYEDFCSQMPSWAAIPFSDITSEKRLRKRFGIFGELGTPRQILIDSTGMVLDINPTLLFKTYGSEGYPFSDERIGFLKLKDKTAFSQPSLKTLLGSSERDFVISNKGDKVPIHTLEDKVVALYFCEDGKYEKTPDFITRELKMHYEELKKNRNFEVVLLFHYNRDATTLSTNEDNFRRTFKTMPWLAIPFKDPAIRKLRRLFGSRSDYNYYGYSNSVPVLVIVGPRGDIIETGAATISRGYDANLFTSEVLAKVEGERVKKLKLEMLCSPNTVFGRKDGSRVQFSELAGRRVIFLFEGDYPEYDGFNFRKKLKERYMHMKGTADEFEVIYIPNSKDKSCHCEEVAGMPWLLSGADELLPGSAFLSFYGKSHNRYQSSFLLAFDRDGSLVRRSICPHFGNENFPFNAAGVEIEGFDIMYSDFCWGYWDTLYKGLLKDSGKQVNFPGGDLLFCSYYSFKDK